MILILSLLVFGIIGYMVGKPKGRASDGFWLCLLLGPLGLLCLLLLPGTGALCPECKGVLGKGARRCMHCGYDLIQIQKRNATVCSFCGALLQQGKTDCLHCGQSASPRPPRSAVKVAPVPAPPSDTLPCPYCYADLDASAMVHGRNKCGACGREFNAD